MAIKKDLSDLPVQDAPVEEEVVKQWPSTDPTLGPLIVGHWFDQRSHDDNLALALPDAGDYRGSYAGSCTRQIMYKITGAEATEPNGVADHWRMDLGSMVHEGLQGAITAAMPDAEHEVAVDLAGTGIGGSMRIDTVNPLGNDEVETCEIKSINGWGYKASATTFSKKGPSGPRESAIIQGALGAVAYQTSHSDVRVTGSRIVYLSLEVVSPKLAESIGTGGDESRFCAEWFIPYAQCVEIVERERDRIDNMREQMAAGAWVKPVIPTDPLGRPSKMLVLNPKTGAAKFPDGEGTKTWQCDYCEFKSVCMDDHATNQANS